MSSEALAEQWEDGVIPDILLGDLITIQSGYAFKSQDYTPAGHFLMRIGNVQDGEICLDNPKYVTLDKRTQVFELAVEDILTSLTGNIGRVARIENIHLPAALNQRVARLIVKDADRLDHEYLYHALCSPAFSKKLAFDGGGAAQQNVSPKAIARIAIPLPPLDEQRRIAEVLRSVDEAIAANRVAVDAARRTLEALATEIVAEAPDTRTVADFGTVVTGGTPSPKNADLWDGDLPFITPGDLDDECISVRDAARRLNASAPHRARVLPANSVLVTCIGSTVGKVAISRRECATNQQINAICCDPALAGYVYLACLAAYDEIVANAGKQAVPIINKSTFSGLFLPCFPRERMLEISEAVDALDDERERSVAALDRLTSTKTSLMTDLLSGRVRVPA